jgi:hypothetical protein
MTMNHQNTICMLGSDDETVETEPFTVNIDCKAKRKPDHVPLWTRCMCQQYCAKVQKMEDARQAGKLKKTPNIRKDKAKLKEYTSTKTTYIDNFMAKVERGESVSDEFVHPCAACEYEKMEPANPVTGGKAAPFNADHMHESAWGCVLTDITNLKMLAGPVNNDISFQAYKPEGKHKGQPIVPHSACECPDGPEPHDDSGCSGTDKYDPDDPYDDIGGEG